MKFNKEYIVEKSFEVFMRKGYDSVSISVLQKELGMSRGTLYNYFKGKEDLFVAVIDKYIIDNHFIFNLPISSETTVLDYINMRYEYMKKMINYLNIVDYNTPRFLNYTAMIIQAAKYYPGFIEKVQKQKKITNMQWKKVLKNSIAKGEVKKDVDIAGLADIFTSGLTNIETLENTGSKLTLNKVLNEWKKNVLQIYNLIKK